VRGRLDFCGGFYARWLGSNNWWILSYAMAFTQWVHANRNPKKISGADIY
jgi:hypothetical protein